jgi:uncharacterized protein
MARSAVLHLLPGALITLFYVLLAPIVRELGFPALMAIFLAILFVLIPFELGYLLYESRRLNGDLSLRGVVLYREPVSPAQLAGLVVALFVWSGIVAVLLYPPLDEFFLGNFFSWLPDWFFLTESFAAYSTGALLVTWALGLVLNGLAGPVVEELYFRGYLLPRLSRLGALAPLANTVLFSLYHFLTPWQNVGRILGLLPMVYAVWWKRDIRIGIVVHCLGNLFAMLALLPLMLG